ncbi:MAG: DUF1028 domain-containing protein [bacterium]
MLRRHLSAAVLAALLLAPSSAFATFSILARDPGTGQIGAAVQSHWFQVSGVIWVEPEVGAVATQSLADLTYGPAALDLLRLGRSASKTLEGLLASDTNPEVRQVAILDADGEIVAHTGSKCIANASHIVGTDYSVEANLMEKDTVPKAMAAAFEAAKGDLASRLLAALDAAQAQGGDIRGQQSAALIVVGPKDTGRPWADRVFDLRVDDSDHPLKELRRLVDVARAYNAMNDGDAAIEKGDFAAAETRYGDAMKGASGNPEPTFWYAVALANKGRVDEAVKLLPKVYALEPRFRQLPARLAASGLLPDDPKLIERLEKARKR